MDSAVVNPMPAEQYSLHPAAGWESEEWAYATGGGFIDIDNDGDMDVVVAEGNDMTPGFIRVYENINGQFEAQATWVSDAASFYGHLSVGDVNGDGWSDVVASRFLGEDGFDEPGGVSVFLNDLGTLSPIPSWSWDGAFSFSCALGDVDNDGDLDLALAVGEAYYNEPDHSRVFENDGTGDFSLLWQSDLPRYSFDVAWVDVNVDGHLDLAFANAQSPHTLYLSNQGVLSSTPSWEGSEGPFEGNTIDFGDVNSDGFPDLLISDNNQLGGLGTVRLFCGPDLELCWEGAEEAQMWSAVSIYDVDWDGDLDLLAGAWWGAVDVYENDGETVNPNRSFQLGHDGQVVEALAWGAVTQLDVEVKNIQGNGLVPIPKGVRPMSIQAGILGDGYLSGPQIEAEIEISPADLLLTDWTPEQGNVLFFRAAQ